MNHFPTLFLILAITLSVTHGDMGSRSAIVTASGMASPSPGKSVIQLHQEAISDALRNARRQSCSTIDMSLQLKNMQLKQRHFCIQSSGKAELIRVIHAGLVTKPSYSYYRVKIEALTLNMRENEGFSPSQHPTPQGPVTLSIQSRQNTAHTGAIENVLKNKFQTLSMQTEEDVPIEDPILVECTIESANDSGCMISWNIRRRTDNQSGRHFSDAHTKGSLFISTAEPYENEVEDLATRLAIGTSRMM